MYPLDHQCRISCIQENRHCIFETICPIRSEILASFRSKRWSGIRRYVSFHKGQVRPEDFCKMVTTRDLVSLFRVYLMTGCVCYYCGRKMVIDIGRKEHVPDLLTVDHFIPFSQGGTHTLDNIRLCCYECNTDKAVKENPNHIGEDEKLERIMVRIKSRWNNAHGWKYGNDERSTGRIRI